MATVVKEKQLSGKKTPAPTLFLHINDPQHGKNLRTMNLMNIKHPKKNSSQVPHKKTNEQTNKNKVIQISRYIFKNKNLPFLFFFLAKLFLLDAFSPPLYFLRLLILHKECFFLVIPCLLFV